MIVQIDDIIKLIDVCPDDFTFTPIENIEIRQQYKKTIVLWQKGSRIPQNNIIELKLEGVNEIDLLFSNSIYKMLTVLNPQKFKDPYTLKTFIEIDKIINTFKRINRMSKRQRHISFLYEMYNLNDEGFNPVIRFNEMIDDEKWNHIKTRISKCKKDVKFPILFNEIGIIILVDLTSKNDSNFIERFRKNADLCSIIVQKKADNKGFNISSEFNELIDVWTVNDPKNLLETYIEKNARLIVVGDTINQNYKTALLQVKNYDRFVRFCIVNDVDPKDSKNLLMNIKKAYHKDNYTLE
jgi:hypothetical protein